MLIKYTIATKTLEYKFCLYLNAAIKISSGGLQAQVGMGAVILKTARLRAQGTARWHNVLHGSTRLVIWYRKVGKKTQSCTRQDAG